MTSDERLAARTRAGDSRAFGELWSRHAKAGLAAARQFHTIADPDDIVAEAFLQIFRAMQRGGGPQEAFRPYLYRTIRNVALGWIPKTRTVDIDDVAETLPSDKTDIETATLEKTVTVRAFRTLPERWQTILWYTEVEGMDPAEAAPYVGLSPNAAAALAYRAREGLKKAWLQAHVSDRRVPVECRWTTGRMADYNRGTLSPRAQDRFEGHLATCTRCSIIVEEIDGVSGRLAAMLFPLVLGGAGAALLAGGFVGSSSGGGPAGVHAAGGSSSAGGPTAAGNAAGGNATVAGTGSKAVVARAAMVMHSPAHAALLFSGAAIVLAAVVTTGAFVATGVIGGGRLAPSSTASTERPGSETKTSTTPAPAPAAPAPVPVAPNVPQGPGPQVSAPLASLGRASTVAPVTSVTVTPPAVPSPPHVTPPSPPVVTAPADGALLANAHPQLAGSGEPGAVLTVERYDIQGRDLGPIATTTVDANGAWAAMPATAIPDGTWVLKAVQTDAAGNRSAPVTRTITIDTIALAPVIHALPANPLEYLPTITGTSEPRAQLTLRDEKGVVIGTTTADAEGRWSFPLADPGRDGLSVTATQRDLAGNLSPASAATAPISFQRPTIIIPTDHSLVASTPDGTAVVIQISGTAGQDVQILIDGTWTGITHTLGTTPITRVTSPLPDGPHKIGVRYYDPSTGAIGSLACVAITIG